jgi:predicted esterase YcpF (UPF0227 family)
MQDILYIHGFLSSPQSAKAQQMLAYARRHPELRLQVPALPVDPAAALGILEGVLAGSMREGAAPPGLIGSSLGGFYANILAARHGLRAVLLNPAVHPHRLLATYTGEQRNYHTGVASDVKPEHFRLLEQLEVRPPHPERLWVLLETGDETLDYRQAEQFYSACTVDVTQGGSHTYEGFAERLPDIVAFLNRKDA